MNSIIESSFARKPLLRVTAILVGLSPFILLEGALRLAGVSAGGAISDPLSGFNRNIPLFEQQGPVYRTTCAREPYFPVQEFRAQKPANGFRVFCFGGSTVHGHPYESETAFPKWLELELAAADPSTAYEVINCGCISYASYRLAPLVAEVVQYRPDLVVVATGENEFLEDRTYQPLKERSALRRWIEDGLQSLRLVTVVRGWVRRAGHGDADSNSLQKEPTLDLRTRLDNRSGYASYHRDDAWHQQVASQFEDSLERMINTCRKAKVPLILMKLGSNLRDCAPYKSEHRPGLSPVDERKWQQLFDAAGQAKDPVEALNMYRGAEQIDPEYALLSFRIAKLLDRQGQIPAALEYYVKARDQDICPLRPLSRNEEILFRATQRTGTPPLLDVAAIIADASMDKIPGNDWYLDHVHPNIGGHQLIAQALVEQIERLAIVPRLEKMSASKRTEMYAAWLDKLEPRYLAEGLRRVEWLEQWARRERLFQESEPQDGPAFLRAGFRHLELEQDHEARSDFETALKSNHHLQSEIKHQTELLVSEGRRRTAEKLGTWCERH